MNFATLDVFREIEKKRINLNKNCETIFVAGQCESEANWSEWRYILKRVSATRRAKWVTSRSLIRSMGTNGSLIYKLNLNQMEFGPRVPGHTCLRECKTKARDKEVEKKREKSW